MVVRGAASMCRPGQPGILPDFGALLGMDTRVIGLPGFSSDSMNVEKFVMEIAKYARPVNDEYQLIEINQRNDNRHGTIYSLLVKVGKSRTWDVFAAFNNDALHMSQKINLVKESRASVHMLHRIEDRPFAASVCALDAAYKALEDEHNTFNLRLAELESKNRTLECQCEDYKRTLTQIQEGQDIAPLLELVYDFVAKYDGDHADLICKINVQCANALIQKKKKKTVV